MTWVDVSTNPSQLNYESTQKNCQALKERERGQEGRRAVLFRQRHAWLVRAATSPRPGPRPVSPSSRPPPSLTGGDRLPTARATASRAARRRRLGPRTLGAGSFLADPRRRLCGRVLVPRQPACWWPPRVSDQRQADAFLRPDSDLGHPTVRVEADLATVSDLPAGGGDRVARMTSTRSCSDTSTRRGALPRHGPGVGRRAAAASPWWRRLVSCPRGAGTQSEPAGRGRALRPGCRDRPQARLDA